MEMVLLIGLQASGKSTFCKEKLFHSHVRINLDMLRTRRRESLLFTACLEAGQSLVVDNTNLTGAIRSRYIHKAKKSGFKVTGYYFQSGLNACLCRNRERPLKQQVPDKAILGMHKKLELPDANEGFDNLYYVSISDSGRFSIQDWKH